MKAILRKLCHSPICSRNVGLIAIIIIAFSFLRPFFYQSKKANFRQAHRVKSDYVQVISEVRVIEEVKKSEPPKLQNEESQAESRLERQLAPVVHRLALEKSRGDLSHLSNFTPGVPVTSVRKILLVSTWRSGSTFLGELISQSPGTFYDFEPLSYFSATARFGVTKEEKQEYLRDALQCRLKQRHYDVAGGVSNTFMVARNGRLWEVCSVAVAKDASVDNPCYVAEFVNAACKMHPVHLVKLVRMQVEELKDMLMEEEDMRVVVLVRDPRATMHSRSSVMDWCSEDPACGDVEEHCSRLARDVQEARQLAENNLNDGGKIRIHLLRYEDLCLETAKTVRKLMTFLGFPLSVEVKNFVQTHTLVEGKEEDEFGTVKESAAHAFAWLEGQTMEEVGKVQKKCSEAMRLLGYATLDKKTNDSSSNLLEKTAEEVWPYL